MEAAVVNVWTMLTRFVETKAEITLLGGTQIIPGVASIAFPSRKAALN